MCFRVAVLCLTCLYAMNVQRPLVSQSHPTSFVRSDLRRTRECVNISHCTSLTSGYVHFLFAAYGSDSHRNNQWKRYITTSSMLTM